MKKLILIALLALSANISAQTFDFACLAESSIIMRPRVDMFHEDQASSYKITLPSGTEFIGSTSISGKVTFAYASVNGGDQLNYLKSMNTALDNGYTFMYLWFDGWIDELDENESPEEINGEWTIDFYSGSKIGTRKITVYNYIRKY